MSTPPPPPSLDRARIVAAALELLKVDGQKGLSTRRLAERLGIKSASLYHHFRDKQQLLDHISAAMIQPAWRRPHVGERWQDWLLDIGYRLRRALNSYRDGALVAAGSSPPPETFQDSVQLLYAPVLAAGFTPAQTRNIIVTVLRFVGGWTFDEQTARAHGVARAEALAEEGFAFGLKVIIAGSAAQHPQVAAAAAAAHSA